MNIFAIPTEWDDLAWFQYDAMTKMDTFKQQFAYIFGIDYLDVNLLDSAKYAWFLNPPNLENIPPAQSFECEGDTFTFLGGKSLSKDSMYSIPLGVIADCHHESIRKDPLSVVACLFWKQGERYSDVVAQMETRKKMFSRLKFTTILGIASFFFVLLQTIASYSQAYSKNKAGMIG
jgi:hypothetical protein